jgi:hypothetical protein
MATRPADFGHSEAITPRRNRATGAAGARLRAGVA